LLTGTIKKTTGNFLIIILTIPIYNDINGKEPCSPMNENRAHLIAKLVRSLASLKLTVIALLLMGLLVIGGTVYQAGSGMYAAQTEVFSAWVIWLFGTLPLPGLLLVATLLFLNLLAAAIFRLKYRWRQGGLLLIHYGLLLLVGGGFFIAVTAQEYFLTLREGESSRIAIRVEAQEARPDQRQEKVVLSRSSCLILKRACTRERIFPGVSAAG
jgi:hypothetical protein